jgi:hypothetical protein
MSNRLGPDYSIGAMPSAPATQATPGAAARLRHAVSVRIARGPSEDFIRRGRNPDIDAPWRFEPTVKGPLDVVI